MISAATGAISKATTRTPGVASSTAISTKSGMDAAAAIEKVFYECFYQAFATRLMGGADEPLYTPAAAGVEAKVFYRADYASSALHEAAHWCIAGAARRRQRDYGYWYEPDGRDDNQQRAFEQVERLPQALEWHFALAAGVRFHISADNLDAAPQATAGFSESVLQKARELCQTGLPDRAELFRRSLADRLGGIRQPSAQDFLLEALIG